jgi:hypothetical protein
MFAAVQGTQTMRAKIFVHALVDKRAEGIPMLLLVQDKVPKKGPHFHTARDFAGVWADRAGRNLTRSSMKAKSLTMLRLRL